MTAGKTNKTENYSFLLNQAATIENSLRCGDEKMEDETECWFERVYRKLKEGGQIPPPSADGGHVEEKS
jgi:hypothetical protein